MTASLHHPCIAGRRACRAGVAVAAGRAGRLLPRGAAVAARRATGLLPRAAAAVAATETDFLKIALEHLAFISCSIGNLGAAFIFRAVCNFLPQVNKLLVYHMENMMKLGIYNLFQ